MKTHVTTAAIACACMITDVAAARPYFVTPSGKPDVVFPRTTAEAAQGKIAGFCMDHAMTVASNAPGQVVCEAKMGMMQSVLTQALIGNSYSTPPRQLVRFVIVPIGEDTRVQANSWVETQMAFGQTRQQPMDGDNYNNGMMGMLLTAGGKATPGTRFFPGAAWLGAHFTTEARKVGRKSAAAFKVTEVIDPSPGAEAGLRVGDVITKVDGTGLKDEDDLVNHLAKAMSKPTFDVAIERAGIEETLTLKSQEQPPAT